MFLVLTANRLLIRRIDLLSSVSLALIIVLILFPYSIHSLALQLSFGCVFGIAIFYRPISTKLKDVMDVPKPLEKLRNWIVAGIAMYLSTALITVPFFIRTFGFYPVVGIIANIVLLPLVIIAFKLSVIALVTYVGFPLLYLADWILQFVLFISNSLAQISWGQIPINIQGAWFWFYFVALAILSRFVFIKKKYKYILSGIGITIFMASILIQNL